MIPFGVRPYRGAVPYAILRTDAYPLRRFETYGAVIPRR
jgi:hypothetical protein